MSSMDTTDPRIGAIYEADPQLKFVGPGTIDDVLKAAEAAGIIPASTVTVQYAVDVHRPDLGVQEVGNGTLREAEEYVKIVADAHHPTLLSRTSTSYATRTSEWQPATEQILQDSRA